MLAYKNLVACALLLVCAVSPLHITASPNHRNPAFVVQDKGVPSAAEQDAYNRGLTLFSNKEYEQSSVVFREFLGKYPKSMITDLILLWLGRSYIEMKRMPDAEQVVQKLRQLADTPFMDIYQNELKEAHRKNSAPPGPNQIAASSSTPQVASNPSKATTNRKLATNGNAASQTSPQTSTRPTTPAREPKKLNQPAREPSRAQPQLPGNVRSQVAVNIETRANSSANSNIASTVASDVAPSAAATNITASEETVNANPTSAASVPASTAAGVGGFSVTVKQVPNLTLAVRNQTMTAAPGQILSVPLVVTNAGNKEDQFRLETDLPAEFQPTFNLASQSASETGLPILVTPQIARGANAEVVLNLRVPVSVADGQQSRFTVRAASQADFQVFKVADASLTVTAAAMTASARVSQPTVQPGDTFEQAIAIVNNGSSASRSTRADFVFDPDFELVSADPAPLVYDRASRTAIWDLREMSARDTRIINVRLRALNDALATTSAAKSTGRGTLRTASLPVPSNFDGPVINVGKVTRAEINAVSTGLTVTPGDTLYIPFVVRNPGNHAEAFELRLTAPGAPAATAYADTNGDGLHQEGEPAITRTTQIEPRGGAFPLLLRVEVPRNAPDRGQYSYNVVTRSLSNQSIANESNSVLTVATPRVRLRTEQVSTAVAPGEPIYYRLVLINEGAGLAKNIVVNERLPIATTLLQTEPALTPQENSNGAQRLKWRVAELAPGDTAVLRIAVRLRPNLNADQTLSNSTSFVFQDSNGNNYQ